MAKEIATTDDTKNAGVPAYLQKMQNGPVQSKDNFDSSDVVLPSIKLLQGTSEQCKTFDDAKPGIFWHTGMDVPLGNELKFVVCSRNKKYLLQAPMDDGQGVLARAADAQKWDRLGKWDVQVDKKTKVTWEIKDLDVAASGLAEWGTYDPVDENSPPAATLFYDYVVILPGHLDLGPAVLSVARSAIRKAKKGLNDKISLHGNAGRPMQSIVFSAKPVTEQNSSNQDYFNWNFTGAGFADEDVFVLAQNLGNTLTSYRVQDEGSQDDMASTKTASEDF